MRFHDSYRTRFSHFFAMEVHEFVNFIQISGEFGAGVGFRSKFGWNKYYFKIDLLRLRLTYTSSSPSSPFPLPIQAMPKMTNVRKTCNHFIFSTPNVGCFGSVIGIYSICERDIELSSFWNCVARLFVWMLILPPQALDDICWMTWIFLLGFALVDRTVLDGWNRWIRYQNFPQLVWNLRITETWGKIERNEWRLILESLVHVTNTARSRGYSSFLEIRKAN